MTVKSRSIKMSELPQIPLVLNLLILFLLSDLNYNGLFLNMDTRIDLLYIIYIYITIVLLMNTDIFIRIIKENKIIFTLLILSCTSYIWTFSMTNTRHAIVMLVGSTLYGLYISKAFNRLTIIKNLTIFIFLMQITNIIVILVLPQFSLYQDSRVIANSLVSLQSYKGIFSHKNSLGTFVSFAFLFNFVFLKYFKGYMRIICYFSIVFSVILIYLSDSSTALLVTILVTIIYLRINTTKKFNLFLFITSLLFVAAIYIFEFDLINKFMILYLNRDATFTGRLDIWLYVVEAIKNRPFLGYGFYGFWLSAPSQYIMLAYQGQIQSSHEGFLDTILNVGIIGFAIYIYYILSFLYQKSKEIVLKYNYIDVFSIIFFIFIIFYNLSECYTLVPNSFYWILQVIIISSFSNIGQCNEVASRNYLDQKHY